MQGSEIEKYYKATIGELDHGVIYGGSIKCSDTWAYALYCFLCTEPSQTSLCGNYRLEQGEQCDVGIVDSNNPDDCCTANCRLKPGKLCRYVCSIKLTFFFFCIEYAKDVRLIG